MAAMPPTRVEYFDLKGGLNLVTPPIQIPAGMCREAQNYEIALEGGYRRIDGYCRFDGRPSPSAAVYYVLPCNITGALAVGDTVTGLTSAATGKVIAIEGTTTVVITKLTGTFTGSEALQVGGTTRATMTSTAAQGAASSNDLNWQYLNLAGDVYRADIAAVPGSGSILGVARYNDLVYAFRNNVGGTAAVLYKSSGSGWTLVTTPALQPGGKYEFVAYNFGSGLMLYGCDGANKAFQFDGTTFTQITTGMAADTPSHIAAHTNRLFLSFGNSLQFSSVGVPATWSPVLGAGELNIGQTITNLKPQPGYTGGAALAVYSRLGTFILYGTSSTDWKLVTLDPEAGAFAFTCQHMGQSLVMDSRGVTTLETTQSYGNFAAASISATIRPYIVENKTSVLTSGISREKNQYRLFFTGGRALYYTLGAGFMPVLYPASMTCYWSGEDSSGNEVAYAGDTSGYVYLMDEGNSFDGAAIEAYVTLVFNHVKSPRVVKRYRKAALEVGGTGYAKFFMSAEIGYGSNDYGAVAPVQLNATLSSGNWDVGVWDVSLWDGRVLQPIEFALEGAAENISLKIAQISDYQAPLTFYGAILHHTPRRQLR